MQIFILPLNFRFCAGIVPTALLQVTCDCPTGVKPAFCLLYEQIKSDPNDFIVSKFAISEHGKSITVAYVSHCLSVTITEALISSGLFV